jgi:ABC-type antimicrobial peptide transport system permease subunit
MMSVLFSIAAAVAIILSCSGLLAMVLLIVQQRVKEIGVRKVLGASVKSISMLISKGVNCDFNCHTVCLADNESMAE